jgi:HD superfamily phosphohydrolase
LTCIDYLLRDSHHTGVAYGKFDHYRLIDELRILPSVESASEAALGINGGGIYSAEALALARYFMFSQVYYHPIRLIYDHHLKDFLLYPHTLLARFSWRDSRKHPRGI